MDVTALRADLADMEAELCRAKDALGPHYAEVNEIKQQIEETRQMLGNPNAWEDHKSAARAKSESLAPRLTAARERLSSSERHVDDVERRLNELKARIARAEYWSVSIEKLQAAGREFQAQARATDSRVGKLLKERKKLEGRQREAGAAVAGEQDAIQGIHDAETALEEQQAASFIDGRNIDLSAYQASIGKARARGEAAKKDAASAKAALPKIAARLEEIDEAVTALQEERKSFQHEWKRNRYRQAEREVISIGGDYAAAVCWQAAIGREIGNPKGEAVLDAAKGALQVPVYGGHTAPYDFSPLIGSKLVPDYSAILKRLRDEFEAGVATQEEEEADETA